MNNLSYFRNLLGLTNAQVSHMLLIRATRYMCIEKGQMEFTELQSVMLAKAYGIKKEQLYCPKEEISKETLTALSQLAGLDIETRLKTLMLNLSDGRYEKPNYKPLNIIINELSKQLFSNSPQE